MDFTPEERQDLAEHRIINVMPLGESMTGKTTLLRTIIEESSSLASERTVVASLQRWTPPQDPNVTALFYDVGGHKSYQNTAHLFQVNSEHTLNFLCHRIYAENIEEWCEATLEWFDIIQISAPKSKTILVFTQVDRMAHIEGKIDLIKLKLKALFQEKLDMEKTHFEESDSDTNQKLYQMHIKNCQDIIEQLKKDDASLSSIPRISCLPNKEKSVNYIVDLMLKFADDLKEVESLAPTDLDLFKQIGTLGLKKDMKLEDHVTAVIENPNPEKQVIETSERIGGKEQYGVRDTSEDQQLEHTVERTQKLRQQYITLTEVRRIFHPILREHHPDKDTDLEKELQKSLGKLKKLGLIRYFTGSKKLAEIIFNDISTMVNILRCVFHHDLSKFKKYSDLKREQRKELTKTKYTQHVACLEKHAIISGNLVNLLLKESGCTVEGDIVLELLSFLNIAFLINDEQSDDCDVAFIPYFLRNRKPARAVDEEKKIGKCYHTVLSLHCNIKGKIPRTYFNEVMVKLYGKMYKAHISQKPNVTWVDGLLASLGKNNCKLLLIYKAREETINFIIQANIEEIQGHHLIFDYIRFIVTESTNIKDVRFEGLPLVFEFICVDCKRRDSATSCVWDIPERLEMFESDDDTIRCEAGCKDLPYALLQPLPKDEEKAKYHHRKLLDYLEKHYTEECTDVQIKGTTDDPKKEVDELKQRLCEYHNKTQNKLSKLCDDCHLKITKTTFERHDIICTLGEVDRGFCAYLSGDIMTQSMREKINGAGTSHEVLGLIRDAFKASEYPKMLAEVLHVLRLEKIGKAIHAGKIEEAYYEERDKHSPCKKCNTGAEERTPEKRPEETMTVGTKSQDEASVEIPTKRLKQD